MPLNSLTVHDFQSIKKSKVDFTHKPSGGAVTTIVGPSSTGKSALLRSLRMLLYNTSSAPVRIQEGVAKTTVTGDFDGTPVRVERGKSLSTYFIGTEKYSKAGTSVPQPVQDVLKIDYSTPLINHSTQFDKPYLLDESGTTVSALIGKLTHANTLRLAVKEGNRRSLESSRLLKTRLSDLEKTREQLTEYAWVDNSVSSIVSSRQILSKHKELSQHCANVQDEVTRADYWTQKHTQASQKVLNHPDVSSDVDAATGLLERCTQVYSALTVLEDKKYFAQKLLDKSPETLDSVDFPSVEFQLQEAQTINSILENIKSLVTKYQTTNTKLQEVKNEAQAAEELYTRTLRAAGVCPTCGNQISSHTVSH